RSAAQLCPRVLLYATGGVFLDGGLGFLSKDSAHCARTWRAVCRCISPDLSEVIDVERCAKVFEHEALKASMLFREISEARQRAPVVHQNACVTVREAEQRLSLLKQS